MKPEKAEGKATSAKKEDKKDKKKKKKEKKEKTTVEPDSVGPELALGDEIQKCPNLVRAMCHIFRVTTSDKYGFNRLKLVFEPKSGLAGIVGGHSGYKRPSLIFSNTSSSSPSRGWASLGFLDSVPATLFCACRGGGASPGDMWSYVKGGTSTSTENQFQTAEKAGVMSRAIDLFALTSD